MKALPAVLSCIAGGIIGYFAGYFVTFGLLIAIVGQDTDGELSRGAAVYFGPAGVLIGAIVGLVLYWKYDRQADR